MVDINDKSQNEERKETTQMSQPNLNNDEEGDERKSTITKEKEDDKSQNDYKIKMELYNEGMFNLIPSFLEL